MASRNIPYGNAPLAIAKALPNIKESKTMSILELMKTKSAQWTLIGLLTMTIFIFNACKKDTLPPNQPTLVSPANSSTVIHTSTILSWNCTDSNDDNLTFNILFENNYPPTTYIAMNQMKSSLTVKDLDTSTTYYWSVEAMDNDHKTKGEYWSFTTDKSLEVVFGSFTDTRDNQTYKTIDIGSQTWFAENLNYETTNSVWYDSSSTNGSIYGRLYKWNAALNAIPDGWHLPSDEEWKILETHLGMSSIEADKMLWRGTDEGIKLKSINGWFSVGDGTNKVGFTALPGGELYWDMFDFGGKGYFGCWWSDTPISPLSTHYVYYRSLNYNDDQIYRDFADLNYTYFSVRCVKD